MNDNPEKPSMTPKEASFHKATAAAAARQKALKVGAGEDAVDALMRQNETLEVAGITLKPYSLATLWALQKVNSKYLEQQSLPVDAFAPIDRDKDGVISKDDVLQNTRLPVAVVEEWFRKVDADEDGQISLAEFVAARGLPRELQLHDVVVAMLCFAEPREIWKAANAVGTDSIMDRAFEIAEVIKPGEMEAANEFMNRWFAKLESDANNAAPPKKPLGGAAAAATPSPTIIEDPPVGS
jgi:hypothetical protein